MSLNSFVNNLNNNNSNNENINTDKKSGMSKVEVKANEKWMSFLMLVVNKYEQRRN